MLCVIPLLAFMLPPDMHRVFKLTFVHFDNQVAVVTSSAPVATSHRQITPVITQHCPIVFGFSLCQVEGYQFCLLTSWWKIILTAHMTSSK